MTRVLLDTNVVVRLTDPGAPEHALVTEALDNLIARDALVCVTPQVRIEFWAVATRPLDANGLGWSLEQTREAVQGLVDQMVLLEDTAGVFAAWLDLASGGVSGKRVHDARIVAVALAHSVESILTLNTKDFAGFSGVEVVHPRDVT